jgi:CheY-like chemotaxis protein
VAKILVVDDEPVNRQLLAAILKPLGHVVLEAANGAEGVEMAKQHAPDLTILDLFMPGMDGTHTVRALRADPATAGLRLALYTASTSDAAMRDFMQIHGIRHAILKPSEPSDVQTAVTRALQDGQES